MSPPSSSGPWFGRWFGLLPGEFGPQEFVPFLGVFGSYLQVLHVAVLSATADAINCVVGVRGALDDVDYSDALRDGVYADMKYSTAAEIQAAVSAVITAGGIAAVVDDVNTTEDGASTVLQGIPALGRNRLCCCICQRQLRRPHETIVYRDPSRGP